MFARNAPKHWAENMNKKPSAFFPISLKPILEKVTAGFAVHSKTRVAAINAKPLLVAPSAALNAARKNMVPTTSFTNAPWLKSLKPAGKAVADRPTLGAK